VTLDAPKSDAELLALAAQREKDMARFGVTVRFGPVPFKIDNTKRRTKKPPKILTPAQVVRRHRAGDQPAAAGIAVGAARGLEWWAAIADRIAAGYR